MNLETWPPFRTEQRCVLAIVPVAIAARLPLLGFGPPAGHDDMIDNDGRIDRV